MKSRRFSGLGGGAPDQLEVAAITVAELCHGVERAKADFSVVSLRHQRFNAIAAEEKCASPDRRWRILSDGGEANRHYP